MQMEIWHLEKEREERAEQGEGISQRRAMENEGGHRQSTDCGT